MTTARPCMVLRCSRPMVDVFATGAGARRVEYAVCAEHDAHLKAGGDWRLMQSDPDHYALELLADPTDLAADGARVVEGDVALHTGFTTQVSSRPDWSHVLQMEISRWGRQDRDELRLFMTRDQLLRLRDMLNRDFGSGA